MKKLQISKFKLKEKPKKFDIRAQTFKCYDVGMASIARMAELISEGRCWRNGNYDLEAESFKKKYVIDSHFIVLDFDSVEETPKEMNEIMECNFWYYTLSQGRKPGNNFRMVWVLKEALKQEEFEYVIKWFMKKFPKADSNTKDISRMWYGGNGTYEVLTEELFDASEVLRGFELRSQPTHRYEKPVHTERVVVKGDWERELNRVTDLWKLYKDGKLRRAQRLLLIGNLKYIESEDGSIFKQVMKYAKNPQEVLRWYEDETLQATPIIQGKTVAEHFSKKLF